MKNGCSTRANKVRRADGLVGLMQVGQRKGRRRFVDQRRRQLARIVIAPVHLVEHKPEQPGEGQEQAERDQEACLHALNSPP
jgi:hypothetical protein